MVSYSEYVLPMVAVGVYVLCAVIKPLFKANDKTKFLPLFAAAVGVLFAFWYNGNFEFSTFISGLVSGLGATGIDQVVSIGIHKEGTDNDEVPIH